MGAWWHPEDWRPVFSGHHDHAGASAMLSRAPHHQVQHRAQVAHVDATLAHHLGQRSPVHGQHRVVCEVLNLRATAGQAPPAQALRLLLPQVLPMGAPAILGP